MDDVQLQPARRRRRKSSSKRKAATWTEYWRSDEFARHLTIVMALVGAAYAGMFLYNTRSAALYYAPLGVGFTDAEVRYLLGTPDAVEQGGRLLRYSEPGRELEVRFGSDGRMNSFRCSSPAGSQPRCQDVRGIKIGTTEDQIWLRLGHPSRESYSGNDKTIHYDGMGLTFQLSLFKVRSIELREGASFTGYFPRALWAMYP